MYRLSVHKNGNNHKGIGIRLRTLALSLSLSFSQLYPVVWYVPTSFAFFKNKKRKM